MAKLCVYIKFDAEKLLENGAVAKAFKKLKIICDELQFECIEPDVWEYEGPNQNDLNAYYLMTVRFRQFGLWDKLKQFLVRYSDGTIKDCIKETNEAEKKVKERAKKAGWLDENGNVIPLPVAKKNKTKMKK